MIKIYIFLMAIVLSGCYGVNPETSEIGSISPSCLDSLAWKKICAEHPVDKINDSTLLLGLKKIKTHFIKPDYILYFEADPKEIIGCDWYTIRVVYNEKISNQTLTGMSYQLSNKEQKRIRNRVLKEIMKYQCERGRKETLKAMKEAVPFAESHKGYH